MSNKKTRGFVVVIVLAIAVVITAVVATQLVSAQKAGVVGTRALEEAQARSVAEACLDEMTRYAQNMFPGTPPVGANFNKILRGLDNTAGAAGSNVGAGADDYLPGLTTRRVLIPPSATTNPQFHTWEIIDPNPGSGALCAVRFDDNSDEGRASAGVDDNTTDRDLSVYVTAIGMFRVPPGTPDATAYTTAHAHITLRRLVQLANQIPASLPGAWTGVLDLKNNNKLCGFGGVEASSIASIGTSCSCGVTNIPGCTPGGPSCPPQCSGCSGTCSPQTSAGPYGVPPVNIHWGDIVDADNPGPVMAHLLNREGWSSPAPWINPGVPAVTAGENGLGIGADVPVPALNGDIGNAAVCSFYGKASENEMHIWDVSDNDAIATLADMADGTLDGNLGATTIANARLTGCGADAVCNEILKGASGLKFPNIFTLDGVHLNPRVDNCMAGGTFSTAKNYPMPCEWDQDHDDSLANPIGGGFNPHDLQCGIGTSPCWKLIAGTGGGSPPPDDKQIGTAVQSESTDTGDTDFIALKSGGVDTLPNVKASFAGGAIHTGGANGVFFGGAGRLCGNINACSACANNIAAGKLDNTDAVFDHGDHWHFGHSGNHFDNSHQAFPAIWVMEAASGKHTPLDSVGLAGVGPYIGAVFAQQQIDHVTGAICCPTCDCSDMGTSLTVGSCNYGGNFGVGNATVVGLHDKNLWDGSVPIPTAGPSKGITLKSLDQIDLTGAGVVVGDIHADNVKVSSGCHIGNLVAYGTTDCGGSGPCSPANICVTGGVSHVGDLESMTSIVDGASSGTSIWGAVVAKQSACFKNNSQIDGIVETGGTIQFKNSATIFNSGTYGTGAGSTTANLALTTFMEATW